MEPEGDQSASGVGDVSPLDREVLVAALNEAYNYNLDTLLGSLPAEVINTIANNLPAADIARLRLATRVATDAVVPAWEASWRDYLSSAIQMIAQNQTWDVDVDGVDMLADLATKIRSSLPQYRGRCGTGTEALMVNAEREVDDLVKWLLEKLDNGTFAFDDVPDDLRAKLETLRR